jgi:hypothetical protein
MASRSAAARVNHGEPEKHLSDAFLRRIFSLVAMHDGWDGGREPRIQPATAAIAVRLASESTKFGAEPEVGPSPDGSILLEWAPAPGTAMEAYVPPPGAAGFEVIVSKAGVIDEERVDTLDDVLRTLASLSTQQQ